jgi:glutathionyl-hydroquinone reductase
VQRIPDRVNGVNKLYQLYQLADRQCTSRVTVPVLWDKKKRTIVSNESADIIRMFNSAFDGLGAKEGDYYPKEQRAEFCKCCRPLLADFVAKVGCCRSAVGHFVKSGPAVIRGP